MRMVMSKVWVSRLTDPSPVKASDLVEVLKSRVLRMPLRMVKLQNALPAYSKPALRLLSTVLTSGLSGPNIGTENSSVFSIARSPSPFMVVTSWFAMLKPMRPVTSPPPFMLKP